MLISVISGLVTGIPLELRPLRGCCIRISHQLYDFATDSDIDLLNPDLKLTKSSIDCLGGVVHLVLDHRQLYQFRLPSAEDDRSHLPRRADEQAP